MLNDDLCIEEDSQLESKISMSGYDEHIRESKNTSKDPSTKNMGSKKNSKKPRRSRLTINEDSDSIPEHRKEIYDINTKYSKALDCAVIFNNYINSSRYQSSKHFLKRKIKFDYEREEKCSMFFNVTLPKHEMFIQPNIHNIQRQGINPFSNIQMGKPGMSMNAYQQSNQNQHPMKINNGPAFASQSINNSTSNTTNVMSSNANNNGTIVNTTPTTIPMCNNNNNNKGLFNINSKAPSTINNATTGNAPINSTTSIPIINSDQRITIPLNSNIHLINQNQPQSVDTATINIKSSLTSNNGNSIDLSSTGSMPNDIYKQSTKIILPNPNNIRHPHSSSHNGNITGMNTIDSNLLMQQNKKEFFKKIEEKYKSDPEALRKEYGDEKFEKIAKILKKKQEQRLHNHDQDHYHHNHNQQIEPTTNNNSS